MIGTKNKHSFNDFAWVKNQKIKKKKKSWGWVGKKVLFDHKCFASLPVYAVGGAMVLFIRVTGGCKGKNNLIHC